jgi:hypothetical protein
MDVAMKLHPSKKDLDLQLHIPDQETECPILQEPIHAAIFDKFPRPFYKTHPEHKAITLACSHTFHAMALVYHWSRNRNVLCPICRAGPQGQRLVLSKLPEDWRYSLSSKVKREKKQDREEAEQENYRVAWTFSQNDTMTRTVVSFVIKIEIQAITVGSIHTTWKLSTTLSSLHDTVEFEVPANELAAIPFSAGTTMRFRPVVYSNIVVNTLAPSNWFISGNYPTPSDRFHVEYDTETRKFQKIKLTMNEDEFSSLIVDAFFAASMV